ncbi:MAG: glycoside hydrolase family 36 N-terminal domain-containing protein, partial [Oscillospiraceae bacterium]
MPITFNKNVFHICNKNMSYCIKLSHHGDLLHMYWGARVEAEELDFVIKGRPSFSAYECGDGDYSLDVLPQEFPSYGAQDLRTPAVEVETNDGNIVTKFRYVSHSILHGKPKIGGLPATYVEDDSEAETLIICVKDDACGVIANLFYTIYEGLNVICRHVEFKNTSENSCFLNAAASFSVDFSDYDYKMMHLHGSWAREKHIEFLDVHKGFQGIDSKRGASGVAENPFIALMRKDATETSGDVFGVSLVYSGNFKIDIEVEQYGTMRVMAGINPHNFKWKLESGEGFNTPEAVLVYSENGMGEMSNTYHKLYKKRLCRGKFRDSVRPILINNWEATYFDFTEDKLLKICDKAVDMGIEMFVLDDGWFGKRNSDTCSLGD